MIQKTVAILKYATDFENITKVSEYTLSMPIAHGFVLGTAPVTGSRMWIEDGHQVPNSPTPHSGTRCIGMQVTTSDRNEFNIANMETFVGPEFYVSLWLYRALDWVLPASGWYSTLCPFQSQIAVPRPREPSIGLATYEPSTELFLGRNDFLGVGLGMSNWVEYLSYAFQALPKGRWVKFAWDVVLHPTQGKVKVWVDDVLICDASNVETTYYSGQPMKTTIAKIYGTEGVGTYRLWVDDLQIWTGIPTATPLAVTISPSSATIPVGQTQSFTSSVSGGTAPYQYQWRINGVNTGTGASFSFAPSTAGVYQVDLVVTDATNTSVASNIATVTVTQTAQHILLVSTTPLTGIPITINGVSYSSPASVLVDTSQTTVTVPATFGGYSFVQWENGSTNPTRQLNVSNDMSLTAQYVVVTQVTMTLAVSGNGAIDIGAGSKTFNVGDIVVLKANPQPNESFIDWQLNGASYTDNPLSLTITADLEGKTLTANFTTSTLQPSPLWVLLGAFGVLGLYYIVKG